MADQNTDILIIGGGLIGATLLHTLEGLGYSTLLIESKNYINSSSEDFDARTLALSPASVHILKTLNLWPLLKTYATPIETIHVSEAGRFGASRLRGDAKNPLGYVMELQHIFSILHENIPQQKIIAPAKLIHIDKENSVATFSHEDKTLNIHAKLIVAADGESSQVRQFSHLTTKTKLYNHQALVANIGLDKPHNYQAFERFTPQGPLALLPMRTQKSALVWTMSAESINKHLNLPEKEFLSALQNIFGYRLGKLVQLGKRSVFPLKQVTMPKQIDWPFVFIGNAAHTLHPVAGQGFNLGLRDVATLAQCIVEQGLNPQMLKHYAKLRVHDQYTMSAFTDSLVEIFTSRIPGIHLARNAGLILFDNLPFLKKILANYARGFGGYIPDLVCEKALLNKEKVHE